MKAIFVDFDGVLNNEIMHTEKDQNRFSCMHHPIDQFDSRCVDRLIKLFEETGALYVMSSSWRIDDYTSLILLNKELGLPIKFSRTPELASQYKRNVSRGEEIKAFLDRNPHITEYAILDDDSDMLPEQMDHFVHCCGYYGLTDEDCEKVKRILK